MGKQICRSDIIPNLTEMRDWGDPLQLPWPAVMPKVEEL